MSTPTYTEHQQPLASSIIWRWQREFFQQQGLAAWSSSTVPHYITNNPGLAAAYATVIRAFWDDCPAQRRYIVELGAGSGRLAFHVLRTLLNGPGQPPPFTYVLTDYVPATVEFWRQHPQLQPFIEQGYLDVACFDGERDQQLHLASGATLARAADQSIVVLANYVFDSLPLDAFALRDGQLHECLISLSARPPDAASSPLNHISDVRYSQRPASANHYPDPACNAVLQRYQQLLDNTIIGFPVVAMRCLRFFQALAPQQLLVLAGDKASADLESLAAQDAPRLTVHGSFSVTVNYHALGLYAQQLGGQMLASSDRHANLAVAAWLWGRAAQMDSATRHAFAQASEPFSPDDFFTLKQGLDRLLPLLSLPQIVAFLRLSRWDAHIFRQALPVLQEIVAQADAAERQQLLTAIDAVWANYYHIGEPDDLAFGLGTLCFSLEQPARARSFFERSLVLYGQHASTAYNLALCHQALDQPEQAARWLAQALELDPNLAATL